MNHHLKLLLRPYLCKLTLEVTYTSSIDLPCLLRLLSLYPLPLYLPYFLSLLEKQTLSYICKHMSHQYVVSDADTALCTLHLYRSLALLQQGREHNVTALNLICSFRVMLPSRETSSL